MAKKKAAARRAAPAKKALVKKSSSSKKTTKNSPNAIKVVKKKTAAAKATSTRKPVEPDVPSLGRPLVTQEEKLYMLFHDDYEARQVFEFLRLETVADLVKLAPEDIVKVLTAPVRRTIQRIRQRLAEKNRSLQGDEDFTRQHKSRLQ